MGHDFQRFYKTISAGVAELPCPECGAIAERRLSGGGGLVFKGSGFYLTDYGKNAHRKPAPEAKSDKSEKTGEPKGESKGESASAKSDARSDSAGGSGSKAEKPAAPATPTASAPPTTPSKSKPKSE